MIQENIIDFSEQKIRIQQMQLRRHFYVCFVVTDINRNKIILWILINHIISINISNQIFLKFNILFRIHRRRSEWRTTCDFGKRTSRIPSGNESWNFQRNFWPYTKRNRWWFWKNLIKAPWNFRAISIFWIINRSNIDLMLLHLEFDANFDHFYNSKSFWYK